MEDSERRALGVKRVPVEAVVEIVGRDSRIPAFEAEAIEVSGRGMHVRTGYLPELNAPLVLRFENEGREVIVEGEVAWRDESEERGDFGIRFTALDSSSVEVLKELCGVRISVAPPDAPSGTECAGLEGVDAEEESLDSRMEEPGTNVKLHIEGLGAPMKARVREGSHRRLRVGSNLEFLRIGRSLEIEDVEMGDRRDAQIHAVSVAVDPHTQVPQLVVSLRYPGAQDVTPQPSVIDGDEEEELSAVDPSHRPPPASEKLTAADLDEGADAPESDGPMADKLEAALVDAAALARRAGSALSSVSGVAARGAMAAVRVAGQRARELRAARAKGHPRRTTKAPAGPLSQRNAKLRPQSSRLESHPPTTLSSRVAAVDKKVVGIALAAVLVGGGVFAMGRTSGDTQVAVPAANSVPVAADELSPVAELSEAPETEAADEAANEAPDERGVVANVPLFGPTAMATSEEQSVDPPGGADGVDEFAGHNDQQFEDDAPPAAKSSSRSKASAFARGRLELPVIHRLRLDAPGAELGGSKTATGFKVTVPGRKVMENGRAIARRDDRIAKVNTENGASGAEVTFVFKGTIPGYKVRLRKDFVEFFISKSGK